MSVGEFSISDLVAHQEKQNLTLRASLHFWEGKRLIYNIAVGIAGIIGILYFQGFFNVYLLIGILCYGIAANVFYSAGFLLEALMLHYFKDHFNLSRYRTTLFFLGLVGAIILTFSLAIFSTMPIPD